MAEFFSDYGLFLLKAVTVVIAFGLIVAIIVAAGMRGRKSAPGTGHIEIRKLNDHFDDMRDSLSLSLLDPAFRKQALKDRKAEEKAERKADKKAAKLARKQRGEGETHVQEPPRSRVFVVNFDGDIQASQVEQLRHEISSILTTASSDDEVVVRLDSGGGMVTSYGLAASQLDRLREHKVPLTICVDKVAASGGYMMACVADKLMAAPFAVVGSIGVVAQMPNFHRLLKKYDIDFELLTAGKYKRTLTIFGENTDEGREKFIETIERIHTQFKQYVETRRPKLDIDAVATGEIWSGDDALEHALVDELCTSDEYLMQACEHREVVEVKYKEKKSLSDRFSIGLQHAVFGAVDHGMNRLARSRFLTD